MAKPPVGWNRLSAGRLQQPELPPGGRRPRVRAAHCPPAAGSGRRSLLGNRRCAGGGGARRRARPSADAVDRRAVVRRRAAVSSGSRRLPRRPAPADSGRCARLRRGGRGEPPAARRAGGRSGDDGVAARIGLAAGFADRLPQRPQSVERAARRRWLAHAGLGNGWRQRPVVRLGGPSHRLWLGIGRNAAVPRQLPGIRRRCTGNPQHLCATATMFRIREHAWAAAQTAAGNDRKEIRAQAAAMRRAALGLGGQDRAATSASAGE